MMGALCSEIVIIDVSGTILPRHLRHSPRPRPIWPWYSYSIVHERKTCTFITTHSEEAHSLVVTIQKQIGYHGCRIAKRQCLSEVCFG